MNPPSVALEFQKKVSEQIRIIPEGIDRFRIFTPFRFDDGDHLAIVLKQHNNQWMLSDEAHTFMHLTYDIDEQDLLRGNRQKIISDALSVFHVEDRDGELIIDVPDQKYGDALYDFVKPSSRSLMSRSSPANASTTRSPKISDHSSPS